MVRLHYKMRACLSEPETRMNHFRAVLALLIAGIALPAMPAFGQAQIPDALEPWRDWVLFGQEFRACPVLNGRDANQEASHICAWPGELGIAVEVDGARFEQSLRREQVKLLERVFAEAGETAVNGWLAVNLALGKSQ